MRFLKSLSVYSIGNMLNAGSAFLLLPIITSHLSPKENGIFSLLNLSVSLLFAFLSLSSHGIIQAEFYRLDREALAKFISSALVNNIAALGIVAILSPLAAIAFNWEFGLLWIIALPFIAFLKTIHQVVLALLQSLNKPLHYFALNSGLVLVTLILGFSFVHYADLSWDGLLLAILISQFIVAGAGLWMLSNEKLLNFAYDGASSRKALLFGLPLIPHAVGSLVIEASSRTLIAEMIGVAALGIYDIGFQLGKVIGLMEVSFNAAYIPFLYERLSENTARSKMQIVRLSYAFLAVLFVAVLCLYGLKDFVFEYIDPEYRKASAYIFVVGLGYFFSGVYKVFVGVIFYFKKVKVLGYLSIFNILTNLALNYVFIQQWGAYGAAVATMISFMLNAIIIAILSNRYYKLPWLNFREILSRNKFA